MLCSTLQLQNTWLWTVVVIMSLTLQHQLFLTEAKRVVFIPLPQMSHINSHMNVAAKLAALRHETWVCVPEVNLRRSPSNSTPVHILPYGDAVEDLGELIITKSHILEHSWAGKAQDVFMMYNMGSIVWKNSMDILLDNRLWNGLRNIKPDLVVLDWTPFCKTALVIPYKLGIPFAFLGTYHDMVNARVPHTSACNPEIISDIDNHMTILERVQNSLIHLSFMIYNPLCDENIIQKFVPEKPPITVSSLSAKAEIFLAETDHVLDYARPTLPNTKLIGGTAARSSKPLEGQFKKFMDEATDGAIVATFGSSVLNIPQEIYQKMTSAFKQLNFRVVWRINQTAVDSNQIMTSLWIPQNDLLGHKNTRMFVSHCGGNGQYEALYHGIPMLCLPLFADQFYNARRVVSKGYGLRADLLQISAQQLAQLIREVAYNTTYRRNIQVASEIFRELYKQPQEEAAFWLDHVLHFGGAYMRFEGQVMPLYQYLLLDVFTIVLGIGLLMSVTSLIMLYLLYRCLCHHLTKYMKRIKHE